MISFRLFNFNIRIEWFFIILLFILGQNYLSNTGIESLIKFLLMSIVIFLSILLHELGHAFIRRKYGESQTNISITGFGGLCYGNKNNFTRKESGIIAFSGPAFNLILGIIAFIMIKPVLNIFNDPKGKEYIQYIFSWVIHANIFLAILNLLPVYPLDGGQIFSSIMGKKYFKLVIWIGIVLSLILAIVFLIIAKQIFAFVIFLMLAFSNFQRLKGKRSSIF